ncbi:MAG: crossover junction endodeoxyribonuclease RuvC [Candidatus Sericytochromatia bacterium]|nr:crossover junction endodeoxyribonuclease RuvC [Candidatus Sericytochromatia bacterium]
MRILGIDPGTATTGYGIIEFNDDNDNISIINYGIIQTFASEPMPSRLMSIYDDMQVLIENFKPDIMAIEELFFFKNAKTVITVSQARGVLLLAANKANLIIAEYTPLEIKLTLTGYGRADKREMQETIKDWLGLETIPKPDDAADALCIAMCHYQHIKANVV